MAKCECSHPESFHPEKTEKKTGALAGMADAIDGMFSNSKGPARACLGETPSGKPCPCTRFIKEEK
jgi:hypothetical protein